MDTQYRKNLKAVLTASKDYTDNSIEKLKWELGTYDLSITTDSTVAYTKTIPTNTIKGRLNYIGGASKVSENLIPKEKIIQSTTYQGLTITNNEDGSITINGSYTGGEGAGFKIVDNLNLPAGTYSIGYFNNATSAGANDIFRINVVNNASYNFGYLSSTTNLTATKTMSETITSLWLRLTVNTTFNNVIIKPMLVKGSTAPTEFSEGFENIRSAKTTSVVVSGTDVSPITKAIPQEVLNDVRYGLGFSDTQFNKLDLITKHLTGEWNIVDLGTLTYSLEVRTGRNIFIATIPTLKEQVDTNIAINAVCSLYRAVPNTATWVDKDMTYSQSIGSQKIAFVNNDYNTVELFTTAMSGVYLLYQTATQFDVDFSQYIDDEFKNIDTTNMTTATFENEFGYDVPSEIDYLIEEVKA